MAHGNKLNEESRTELLRKVWNNSLAKRMRRKAPSDSRETKGTETQETNRGVEDTHNKRVDDRKRDDSMGPEETIAAGDDEIRATHKSGINMEKPAETPNPQVSTKAPRRVARTYIVSEKQSRTPRGRETTSSTR